MGKVNFAVSRGAPNNFILILSEWSQLHHGVLEIFWRFFSQVGLAILCFWFWFSWCFELVLRKFWFPNDLPSHFYATWSLIYTRLLASFYFIDQAIFIFADFNILIVCLFTNTYFAEFWFSIGNNYYAEFTASMVCRIQLYYTGTFVIICKSAAFK